MYKILANQLYEVNQVLKQFKNMTYDSNKKIFYSNTSGRDFFLECPVFVEEAIKLKVPSFTIDCKELFTFLKDGKKSITQITSDTIRSGDMQVPFSITDRKTQESLNTSFPNIREISDRISSYAAEKRTDLLFDLMKTTSLILDEEQELDIKNVVDLLTFLKENKKLTNNDLVFLNFFDNSIVLRSSKTFLESDIPMFITDRHCFRKYKHLVKNNHEFKFVFKNENYETLLIKYGNEAYRISILMHGNFILDE